MPFKEKRVRKLSKGAIEQSLIVITCELREARENVGDQVTCGFSLAYDWLSEKFFDQSQSEIKQSLLNPGVLLTLV